jgi:hypothetical protein
MIRIPRRSGPWRKSMQSGLSNCVQVAPLDDCGVTVRDSKNPGGPTLRFTAEEWAAFAAGMGSGAFDHLLRPSPTEGTARGATLSLPGEQSAAGADRMGSRGLNGA